MLCSSASWALVSARVRDREAISCENPDGHMVKGGEKREGLEGGCRSRSSCVSLAVLPVPEEADPRPAASAAGPELVWRPTHPTNNSRRAARFRPRPPRISPDRDPEPTPDVCICFAPSPVDDERFLFFDDDRGRRRCACVCCDRSKIPTPLLTALLVPLPVVPDEDETARIRPLSSPSSSPSLSSSPEEELSYKSSTSPLVPLEDPSPGLWSPLASPCTSA